MNDSGKAIGGNAWQLVDLAGLGFVLAYAASRRWRKAPESSLVLLDTSPA